MSEHSDIPRTPEIFNDPVAMKTSWQPLSRSKENIPQLSLRSFPDGFLAFHPALAVKLNGLIGLLIGLSFIVGSLFKGYPIGDEAYLFSIAGGLVILGSLGYVRFNRKPIFFDRRSGNWWVGGRNHPMRLKKQIADLKAIQIIPCPGDKSLSRMRFEMNLVDTSGKRTGILAHSFYDQIYFQAFELRKYLGLPVWDLTDREPRKKAWIDGEQWTKLPLSEMPFYKDDPIAAQTGWTPMKKGGVFFSDIHRIINRLPASFSIKVTVAAYGFIAIMVLTAGIILAGVLPILNNIEAMARGGFVLLLLGAIFFFLGLYVLRFAGTDINFDLEKRRWWKGPARWLKLASGSFDDIHALQVLYDQGVQFKFSSTSSFELNIVHNDGSRTHLLDGAYTWKPYLMYLEKHRGIQIWDTFDPMNKADRKISEIS